MDTELTIINVKDVRKSTWNAATQAASLRKEKYGHYVSNALDLRLRHDAGEINVSGEAANQALTPDQRTARLAALAELAKGISALKAATGRATGINVLSRELTGLLAPQAPLIRRQESGDLVKNRPILEAALPLTDSPS